MNQRESLHGGGNSPAFSSDDALRAAGLGIVLSPADVLATKQAAIDCTISPADMEAAQLCGDDRRRARSMGAFHPSDLVLSTLRNEAEARKLAEKRITMLEDAIREHTSAFDRATAYLAERQKVLRSVERWKRLAFLSVPFLALETALILWLVTR